GQRVAMTTLGEVGTFLASETPPTPAIVVAGRVVAWRDILDWYKDKLRVIAAPSSGSGKTVITFALLAALRRRGVKVAGAKSGPDYLDPRFHEQATGRTCFNLDPWTMRPGLIADLAARRDADLVVIEGVMGLFDGPIGGGG